MPLVVVTFLRVHRQIRRKTCENAEKRSKTSETSETSETPENAQKFFREGRAALVLNDVRGAAAPLRGAVTPAGGEVGASPMMATRPRSGVPATIANCRAHAARLVVIAHWAGAAWPTSRDNSQLPEFTSAAEVKGPAIAGQLPGIAGQCQPTPRCLKCHKIPNY